MIDFEKIAIDEIVKGTTCYWNEYDKLCILFEGDVINIGIDKDDYFETKIDDVFGIVKEKVIEYMIFTDRKNKLNKILNNLNSNDNS